MPSSKPKRISEAGKRHRKDNGPQALEVTEAPTPSLASQGTLHVHTEDIITSGAKGLIDNEAKRLAETRGEAFGEEFKAQWTFVTPWITTLLDGSSLVSNASNDANEDSFPGDKTGHVNRARARYAMQWRPVFLATVALAHSITIGAKAAGVCRQTVLDHRDNDPDFDAQVIAAQAHCVEMLHAVTMRDALEGILEPVYWQGIKVGHVRKVDNRLRVELLRAHMPTVFKTPGSKVNVNTGNQMFLGAGASCDANAVQELMAMRQRSLNRLEEKMVKGREIGTLALPPVPPTP